MNRGNGLKNSKAGVNLTEIMIAMTILAVAFIPIIGVMGSSMKLTDKDNRTIMAVNICQQKLNKALQFPFGKLEPTEAGGSTPYGGDEVASISSGVATNAINLVLGPETYKGFSFQTQLTVSDEPVTFHVPVYDPLKKLEDTSGKPDPATWKPSTWGWKDPSEEVNLSQVYSRYTMQIKWKDKGDDREKFYNLVSYKAKVWR